MEKKKSTHTQNFPMKPVKKVSPFLKEQMFRQNHKLFKFKVEKEEQEKTLISRNMQKHETLNGKTFFFLPLFIYVLVFCLRRGKSI